VRVVQHVLQIADDVRSPKVGAARRDKGLVHMQRASEPSANAAELYATGEGPWHVRPLHDGSNGIFAAR
jgi:hypothetical protein